MQSPGFIGKWFIQGLNRWCVVWIPGHSSAGCGNVQLAIAIRINTDPFFVCKADLLSHQFDQLAIDILIEPDTIPDGKCIAPEVFLFRGGDLLQRIMVGFQGGKKDLI